MNLLLHPKTAAQLDSLTKNPTGSVILHGPRGLGKSSYALELAARLNCLGDETGPCTNCRMMEARNFPDLHTIRRGEKPSIGIEQVRKLLPELSLRPYSAASQRMVIIEDAHLLTLEAQNALLKLLEEPPPATMIILTSHYIEALLITVRSRCRAVLFSRPGVAAVAEFLIKTKGITGPEASKLASVSSGVPGVAVTLAASPTEAQALIDLTLDAAKVEKSRVFDRLLLATRLAAAGVDVEAFGEALHRSILSRLMSGEVTPDSADNWMGALELFRRQIQAKVSVRVALERLMLELN